MRARFDEFLLAAALLTRLPVPAARNGSEGAFARAIWAYPLVGAGLGAGAGAVFVGAWALGMPPLVASFLALAALTALTGALHEDGLADFADGLGGGSTREEKLRIMSDSRIGTYGAVALIFSFGLRAAALAALSPAAGFWALAFAAALGRGLLALPLLLLPPAKPDGLGRAAAAPPYGPAGAALAIGAGLALFVPGGGGFWAVVVALGAVFLVTAIARRHLGGTTGDALGAAEQAGETVALAVLAAAA